MTNEELERAREDILSKSHVIKTGFGDIVIVRHEAFDNPMSGVDFGEGMDCTIKTEVKQIGGNFLIGRSAAKLAGTP